MMSTNKKKNSGCHSYNTRASASGNFYINSADLEVYKMYFSRFGAKLWNEISTHFQHLPKNNFSKKKKKTLRKLLFHILNSEDNCIDLPTLITGLPVGKWVDFPFYYWVVEMRRFLWSHSRMINLINRQWRRKSCNENGVFVDL